MVFLSDMDMNSDLRSQFDSERVISCERCGLNSAIPQLEANQSACCSRCGHKLTSFKHNWVDKVLALGLSSLALLALSLFFQLAWRWCCRIHAGRKSAMSISNGDSPNMRSGQIGRCAGGDTRNFPMILSCLFLAK